MLLLFFLKSHTATLHSGNQASLGEHRFNDVSAILDCKDSKKMWTFQTFYRNFKKGILGLRFLSRAWVVFDFHLPLCLQFTRNALSATNLQEMPCLSALEGWQQGGSRWQQNYIFLSRKTIFSKPENSFKQAARSMKKATCHILTGCFHIDELSLLYAKGFSVG